MIDNFNGLSRKILEVQNFHYPLLARGKFLKGYTIVLAHQEALKYSLEAISPRPECQITQFCVPVWSDHLYDQLMFSPLVFPPQCVDMALGQCPATEGCWSVPPVFLFVNKWSDHTHRNWSITCPLFLCFRSFSLKTPSSALQLPGDCTPRGSELLLQWCWSHLVVVVSSPSRVQVSQPHGL